MKKLILFIVIALAAFTYSCTEDSLDPTLAQNKVPSDAIKTVRDISTILNGAYNRMTQTAYYGRDMILYGEVRSDNCWSNGNSGRIITPASMAMGTTDAHPTDTWTQIYRVIASANVVIGQETVTTLVGNQGEKDQVVGEAYALRALAHFDLLRLFGQQHVTGGNNVGIPYVKAYKGDLFPARSSVAQNKADIYADLTKAASLMNASRDRGAFYMSTNAVEALRARVAIYFGDWAIAKTACELVIGSGDYSIVPLSGYVDSWFTKEPVNSIFELAFSSTDNMDINGIQNIYRGTSYGDVRVLANLRLIFDPTDVRNSADMIAPQYYSTSSPNMHLTNVGKYPQVRDGDYTSDIFILRYEEVILNYAEALFELNNADPNALVQLNSIPAKRGALAYAACTKDNILKERRRELCFEGFRFDDLARTHQNMPKATLPASDQLKVRYGTVVYGAYNYAFPIPRVETTANANCAQNLGYN